MELIKGQTRVFINKHIFLVRYGKWTLYFPSSLFIGSTHIVGSFKNWSIFYLTLERRDRDRRNK